MTRPLSIALYLMLAAAAAALALSACAVTQAPAPKLVYDFGPAAPVASNPAVPALAPLALAEVQTSVSLDTTAVQFRLAYVNAQELRLRKPRRPWNPPLPRKPPLRKKSPANLGAYRA